MNTRHVLMGVALLGSFAAATCLLAADSSTISTYSDKALVIDGHVVHNANNLRNHVTNWGLIGSQPGVPTPFSSAPSARWGGIDYLWAAGMWFGGTVGGQAHVTTGQFPIEFQATDAPGDTIFATAAGAPGGARYPWPGADDDGDGAENEDPLDGLDNDLDGLIDEDFAAIGAQEFRCRMADNLPEIIANYPDHTPLNLRVIQESYQWSDPLAADFIGYEYQVTNIGPDTIEGFHCGIFSDFDIGAQANDDMVGSFVGEVTTPWGPVPVSLGWMRDAASVAPAPGWVGFVLCGVETDAAAGTPVDPVAMWSFQRFSGNAAFGQGGDPTNDTERYQLLHEPGRDPDSLPGQGNDYRILLSTPEISTLAPGESVVFRSALVIGGSEQEMLDHAGEAVVTALGQWFDRDGDSANGDEYHVSWIRPDEVPVPAVTGHLRARPGSGSVTLDFDVRYPGSGRAEVERRAAPGVPGRAWALDPGSGRVTDDDAVGWPRTYDLKLKSVGGPDLVLDTVEVPGPTGLPLQLEAVPNPFNPRLTVRFSLPAAGAARMEVLDLQGRIVRVLFDEYRSAGSDQVMWNGLDDQGRAAASGVYLVRLVSGPGTTQQQVTLLR